MTFDTDITIKTNNDIKHEAEEIFDTLGLDMGTAMNIFLHQVIIHHGLPFRVAAEPNDTTYDTLDGEDFYGPFYSVEDLMRDLND